VQWARLRNASLVQDTAAGSTTMRFTRVLRDAREGAGRGGGGAPGSRLQLYEEGLGLGQRTPVVFAYGEGNGFAWHGAEQVRQDPPAVPVLLLLRLSRVFFSFKFFFACGLVLRYCCAEQRGALTVNYLTNEVSTGGFASATALLFEAHGTLMVRGACVARAGPTASRLLPTPAFVRATANRRWAAARAQQQQQRQQQQQ
jgi:hypothetical protein